MIQEKDVYRIGRVGKPHGIKGEVQIQVDDDVFDRTSTPYLILRVDGILVPFFMEEYRFKSDEIVLVRFEDISSAAERAAKVLDLVPAPIDDGILIDDGSGTGGGEVVRVGLVCLPLSSFPTYAYLSALY